MLHQTADYLDEFGEIDSLVLTEALRFRPVAEKMALEILDDDQIGQILLMKAAAKVSEQRQKPESDIPNVKAYLYKTFRHLILAEANKRIRRQELEELNFDVISVCFQESGNPEEKVFRAVLINEIESKMDAWTLSVFRHRNLGYGYAELVPDFGSSANIIRAEFSRNLSELARQLNLPKK